MLPSASTLPGEIEGALRRVSRRTLGIIELVCGVDARAKDVSDAFKVHAKLGWQIWNVAHATPYDAFRFLPNDAAMRTWRSAAQESVPAEVWDELEVSIAEVRKLLEIHATDPEMFEILIDACGGQEESEVKWRKLAFQGNSFTFGARVRCQVSTAILFPSSVPNRFDLARIHGFVDLVRIRSNVRWPISSLVVEKPDGDSGLPVREPILPTKEPIPFLENYCSSPLPEITRRQDGNRLIDELSPGIAGRTGGSTIFTGEILRDVGPIYGTVKGEIAHFGSGVRTPGELLISDHIVHYTLFPGVDRELRVYSELNTPNAREEHDRLAVGGNLEHLGKGLAWVRTSEVPQYYDLLNEVFNAICMKPTEFDVFRVRMRYPPIPASVMVRHELPLPP